VTEERAKQLSRPRRRKGSRRAVSLRRILPLLLLRLPRPKHRRPLPPKRARQTPGARGRPNVHSGAVISKIHRAGLHDGGGADRRAASATACRDRELVDDRIARSRPKLRSVTFHAGAAWRRLYSARLRHASSASRSRAKPSATIIGDRLLALDEALQNGVEHIVGRQRVLVGLVLAAIRGRRLVMTRSGMTRRQARARPAASRCCAACTAETPASCRDP